MNLKSLSDSDLVSKLKSLAAEERKLTLEILHFLREVEARRLYSARAYASLHEFCVKELGYSSGAAFRRIESMRLLRDVPEVEEKILSGALNISVLSQVQTYVKQEKREGKIVSTHQKQELLEGFVGKSSRDVQRALVTICPKVAPKYQETVRAVSETETALRLIADQELMALLDQVKSLGGVPGEDLKSTLKRLARFYISKKTQPRAPTSGPSRRSETGTQSRGIPKATQIVVRAQAGHQCQYHDPQTGRRCTARVGLQFDHKIPYAKGGSRALENLQLLCQSHNSFKAIQDFGESKMLRFLGG